MINERIFKGLKQTNISVNSAKTKERARVLWKDSTKNQKAMVEELANISRATIYRVFKTGNISAKLVAPMAMCFNVDPNYLTGETDMVGGCTDEQLINFLTGLGYGKLITDVERGRRRPKEKIFTEITDSTDQSTEAKTSQLSQATSEASSPITTPGISNDELTLADLHLLMQSLLLREEAGVAEAVEKASKLRALLLS